MVSIWIVLISIMQNFVPLIWLWPIYGILIFEMPYSFERI